MSESGSDRDTSAAGAVGETSPPPRSVRTVRVEPRRIGWVLLAAATFVIGLFLGGIIVGLIGPGSSTPAVKTVTTTVAPSGTPAPGSSGAAGQVTVNQACLRALNEAQSSYGSVADLISALRSLDAARIDAIIQQLQPLENALRADLQACKVSTTVQGPVASSTP